MRMTLQTLFGYLLWTGLSALRKKRDCYMVSTRHTLHLCSNCETVILKKVGMGIRNNFLPSPAFCVGGGSMPGHCFWYFGCMCSKGLLWAIPCLWWQRASQMSNLGNPERTLQTMHCKHLGQLVDTKLRHTTCLHLSCVSNLMCFRLL